MTPDDVWRDKCALVTAALNKDSAGVAELVEHLDVEQARDMVCALAVAEADYLAVLLGREHAIALCRSEIARLHLADVAEPD